MSFGRLSFLRHPSITGPSISRRTNDVSSFDSSVIGFDINNRVTVYNVTNLAASDFLIYA
jgi:hypothetical protein